MGKKEIKEILCQSDDRKTVNPIIAFLAFLLGAVTAFTVFWRMRVSKGKKRTKVSDDAVDRDYEAADREMKHLISVLRRESERRMWGDPEIRISGDYGVSGTNPSYIKTAQVKPYRPRKRVSAKKIFGRVVAAAVAVALVVTGLKMVPSDVAPASTVLAKESFGGIKQVVEEHDEDNPFVILDIVPGKACVDFEVDGKKETYEFSLGTIGYFAPGQSPIQQDLFRIFTGDDKEDFYDYTKRINLKDLVIGSGDSGLVYQEAYGGTGEDLRASMWSKIYDPVEDNSLDGSCPTGRLMARVEERPVDSTGVLEGYDYDPIEFNTSVMSLLPSDGIYAMEGGKGDYQVIFSEPEMAASGYRPEEIRKGSYVEALDGFGDMTDATGLYIKENGVYRYACTIGELKGKPRPDLKPKPEPEEPKEEGTGEGNGEGNGEGTGEGNGEGTGEGNGEGTGEGTGEGNGEGTGEGNGEGTGEGNGEGTGEENGEGTGEENGEGINEGTGEGARIDASQLQPVSGMAGTADGWYLCVNTDDLADFDEYEEPEETPVIEGEIYYVLEFTYVPEADQKELLYQKTKRIPFSTEGGEAPPWDSYILGNGMLSNSLYAVEEEDTLDVLDGKTIPEFKYVGGGIGKYKLTRMRSMETASMMSDAEALDAEQQDEDSEDAVTQDDSTRARESVYEGLVEVQNAPVYIRCTGGNDFLRRYVFNSLKSQDNASDNFAIRVDTVLAGDVEYWMVQEADLIYLEDGKGLYLGQDGVSKIYLSENAEDGLADISDEVITSLLYEAVEELKPIIVDYGIIESEDYPDSNYQKLAKAFRKKDLTAFYYDMAKSSDLAASVLMNVDKDSFPNKTDNDYHYVNKNVYIVNGTPLVGDDFPEVMDKDEAKAGFSEVLAAIRTENVMLSEDEKISEKISKAMAVQYIINYSLGLVGEYKDLSILELQPTANKKTDLHSYPNPDKDSVVLYWYREDRDGEDQRQQILRSSKMIEIDVDTSSAAAFNSSYQDINAEYNMIFIGLDGQRLYRDWDKEGKLSAVYNDNDLNGKVYHTGDRVADSDTRYDANDITEQKKEALLDYLRAGYPIVVENEFFKDRSARNARERDINTDYIADNTQMYAFLKEAISMGRSDEDDESGVGIYTIEDVHRSAMFAMQLNAQRPKIELWEADENTDENGENDSEEKQISSDMIGTEPVPEKEGILRGTIEYRISSDRTGEDKTYQGSLERHLYFDLNYDGVYAPEEEITEYQYEETSNGGKVSVDFNEISFGIVPWKLEVTDADNEFRRASIQGCFTISSSDEAKIRVLQVLDDTTNKDANFQEQYEKIDESMLAHYLRGAEALLNMSLKIETVTPKVLEERLSKNANYLSLWDVMVLGFGDSGNPGDVVTTAVNDYITAGGSVLVSSAGASTDKGRLGLSAAVLGQQEGQTYGKLGLNSGSKFRYDGILAGMFNKTSDLLVDRVNEGTITRWPYEIGDTASLEGTEVSMPDYLLDIGTVKDMGQPYATAWFTLIDSDYEGGYSVSPRDGQNNYYVYSMGNMVYVGQSEYPYTYDRKTGEIPEGDGIDECMIFVNALMAAYNAGVHRAQVSIVAGFNGASKVESVTIPYDVAFKENGDGEKHGILGETVDVYFRFTDNNIASDKTTDLLLYYKKAGAPADASLLLSDGGINETDYEYFTSPVWAVENNRLVEVTEGLVPGKVYRIKAPLTALQGGDDETSEICVLLKNRYTRAGQEVEALSMDSVSLNRAQMFLLE